MWRYSAALGGIAIVCWVAGKLGLLLAFAHAATPPVWPASGIALAALLILGYRIWPGIFLGAFLVSLTITDDVTASLAVAAGNTIEGVAGLWLINRYAGGYRFFKQPLNVLRFALFAGIVSLLSPPANVASLSLRSFTLWARDLPTWFFWWLGDMLSVMVVTPLLVAWAVNPRLRWNRGRVFEFALLTLLLVLVIEAVFGEWSSASVGGYLFAYLCLPFLVWTAFRFSQREVATISLVLAVIAIWGTLHGHGLFAEVVLEKDLLQCQGFMAFNAVIFLAVAAVVAQHREAEQGRLDLLRRLDESQETERGRISRELHDRFGQQLTALKLGLQMVNQKGISAPDLHECVRRLKELADDLMQNIHRLAWELRPAVLDDFGLDTALPRYAEEWSQRSGVLVDIQSRGMEGRRLPVEIETTLYRIMQEALTNVFRHAKARRVGLLLERRPDHVSLIVEDDGQGFDTNAWRTAAGRKGKLGLLGMEERVMLAGGTLEVESTSGQGTTVLARIPLRQQSAES